MSHHRKHATVPQSVTTRPTTATQTGVTSGDKGKQEQRASTEIIRLSAYQKWENAGKPTGDGIQFWLEAEQELTKDEDETFAQREGAYGPHGHKRRDTDKAVKDRNVKVDSHYRDNNRMFQSHGERGHRHGGNG